MDKTWAKILQDGLGALKHAEFGLGTSMMQAQCYGYTEMINTAILTNSSYKLRFAEDITLYLVEIGLNIEGFDENAGKKHWARRSDPAGNAQGDRIDHGRDRLSRAIFRDHVVFEPLVGELFRSGFIMQAAASQGDFATPTVVSAAEADYERNLANTVELIYILTHDKEHGAHNKGLFNGWMAHHAALANEAASNLQPIGRSRGSRCRASPRPRRRRKIGSPQFARKST